MNSNKFTTEVGLEYQRQSEKRMLREVGEVRFPKGELILV